MSTATVGSKPTTVCPVHLHGTIPVNYLRVRMIKFLPYTGRITMMHSLRVRLSVRRLFLEYGVYIVVRKEESSMDSR
jgi:hypothetical protein